MNKSLVLEQYDFSRNYLTVLVEDIPEDRMAEQPGLVVNHPAWQLGHMAYTADQYQKILSGVAKLESTHAALFASGSMPIPNRSMYPSRLVLLELLDDRRSALIDAVRRASDADFARVNPNPRVVGLFPTVGHFLLYGMLQHEFGHLNELAVWRRAAGLPAVFGKMMRR